MQNTSITNVQKNMKYITKYYKDLTEFTKQNKSVGSVNEWLVDNYYLLSEQEQTINYELKSMKVLKIKGRRRAFLDGLVNSFFVENKYRLETSLLFHYFNEYQKNKKDYFSYDEVDYINSSIKCNIIAELKKLSEKLSYKFIEKNKIDSCFKNMTIKIAQDPNYDISNCITFDQQLLKSNYRILEINQRLNLLGENSEIVFVKLNEFLNEHGTSLKEIINLEYEERAQENILMSNLISSFKTSIRIKIEDLYSQINFAEQAFISESANIYDNMYEISKIEYRRKLKQVAKKIQKNEFEVAKKIVAESSNSHIGFTLFKEKKYSMRSKIYVFGIIATTLVLDLIVLFSLGIIPYLLFLIPICGFVIDSITQILMKKVDTQLFRMKLEDGLPTEYATMVVIPTIVKNNKKIDQMYDNLELYYLSNRSDNLHFCLLADVSSENSAKTKMDDKILKAGLDKVKLLNDKYGDDIFHFVYRNRFFNEGENSFLGHERKRGALEHFNQLLLHKFNENEKEKWFKGQTIDNLKSKIKYVITLDADTKLLLNTALKLVGSMVHPMNLPVLSVDETKVVKGHAIMQPRVSIDVEVTNKSIYSQLFAGLGGLDIYSLKHFDLYQDAFGEGTFTGKGIYDLEIFDKLLSNTFPDNLILSHDLLEGNYLRCGYISDIELFDGFPSKYLNDMARHHRWTRGDWQIISWLGKCVKNKNNEYIPNPLNLIEKWKIFDNLRRSLRNPMLFLIVMYAFIFSSKPLLTMILVLTIIAVPITFYLWHKITSRQKYDLWLRYYLKIIFGTVAVFTKTIISFALLPFETFLYLDAIIRALYRMIVSKKNLLNWIISEDVDNFGKNNLLTYLLKFKANIIAALIVIASTIIHNDINIVVMIAAALWISAPFIMYLISKDITSTIEYPGKRMESDVRDIALKTWHFFDALLIKDYNYLVPDNYQLNRNDKIDSRTSPTNIGFSLVSIISAYELKIIDEGSAVDRLNNVIKNVEQLKKWHGHLYNWYETTTRKVLPPYFISTADSGNFVSSLYTVKGFLNKINGHISLKYRVQKLIDNTDFSKLYNEDLEVFSIGYVDSDGSLVPYNYNNFLSEARLVSFIAIAKGDVPFKHWFRLDKTLTKYKWYKGVVSWTGTMFEYYMPLIFMKTYEHTLLDETYSFAVYAQKEFMREVDPKLPWGITESAYNELDDAQNYKYKAFGIPYLKFHDSEVPNIVVAPYGSLMALTKFPMEVYNNIKKMKRFGMVGEYGFFESYDHEDGAVVKAYFSHHQGMILASITNYLKNNVLQDYFHSDKNIQSVEILLKEKVQIRTYIDLRIAKYKKFNYNRDIFENDYREQEGIKNIPDAGILSNGLYTTFINDRGIGFSKYKNLQINRYHKMTDNNHGVFVYVKNKTANKVWSNTYLPACSEPDKYHVVFASDRIKFVREDDEIITTTVMTVTKDHNAEIRKITFENTSEKEVELELTSYSEVIMARPEEDIAHPAFNSITIGSEIDEITSSLIFTRKSRTKENTKYFIINRFFNEDDDGVFEYETSRMNFIGRNNTTTNPQTVYNGIPLKSDPNELIDPIMSIRKKLKLKPEEKQTYYLLIGFGKSKEQVMDIVYSYNTEQKVEAAFDKATLLNNMRNRYAGLSGNEIKAYNNLLKYVYQPIQDQNRYDILKQNVLNQQNLWRFGISGDIPIMLVEIKESENTGFIKEVLQAYEFYKSRAIYIDIVIINSEIDSKKELVQKYIDKLMYRINNLNYFENSPGGIIIINDLSEEEKVLLKTVCNLFFDGKNRKTLGDHIIEIEKQKVLIPNLCNRLELEVIKEKDIYGEFSEDGMEYIIYDTKTPMPWSNVLANENFGTLITNNFGGFTYAFNSREFKLTSWSNDAVTDKQSEIIYINGMKLVPSKITHGLGYSIFESITKDFDVITKVFVPINDNVKIYDITVNSKTDSKYKIDFEFKPVLGTTEESTLRYIVYEMDNTTNSLILKNNYSKIFRNEKMFVTSSNEIVSFSDNLIYKSISTNLDETNRMTFVVGVGNNEDMYEKYKNLLNVDNEFNNVVAYWKDKVTGITLTTPDTSLNYLTNGWLLYQVYASRLYSKAAFYQVGGATGFRDQLQDSMCLLWSNPEFTRNQILIQANHQFIEGDVLHWWHKETSFGAKTRFSDDYLWLVYVTYEYLKSTNDYSILEEKVGFVEGEPLFPHENEKGITFNYSANKETLYYHLKIAIEKAVKQMGSHNLPLMGCGDWNDGMNKVGHHGTGESVWVGFFLYDLLLKFSEISTNEELTSYCLDKAFDLKTALNTNAWDGSWYLRAFYDNGDALGSNENLECQIDLISQSWSILTGVANKERARGIIDEVDQHLVDVKKGIIKLLNPAFTGLENNPGYISDYIPGVRENGAQYTHAALWYIMALVRAGETKKAHRLFSMINPINKNSDIYKVEPYVIAADVYSNDNFPGQGGWTWYTGSASWTYKVVIEELIGIKKIGDELHITPNFPSKWESIDFSYKYQDTTYNLKIIHSKEKNVIKLINDAKIHNLIIGKKS